MTCCGVGEKGGARGGSLEPLDSGRARSSGLWLCRPCSWSGRPSSRPSSRPLPGPAAGHPLDGRKGMGRFTSGGVGLRARAPPGEVRLRGGEGGDPQPQWTPQGLGCDGGGMPPAIPGDMSGGGGQDSDAAACE